MTAFRAARIISTVLAVISLPALAHAQSALLQGGPVTPGHVPMYVNGYSQQPIVQDSGTAAGGPPGTGLSELGLTVRGTGTAPYANAGTGPYGTNECDNDAPTTNNTGYHYLCFSPNAQGGGLIAYGAAGGAAQLPLQIMINGTLYQFPPEDYFHPGSAYPRRTISGTTTTDTATYADAVIDWNSTAAVAKTEAIPACSIGNDGELLIIKDEAATSGLYPITITPAGGTIEKGPNFVATINSGSWSIICDGSTANWTAN